MPLSRCAIAALASLLLVSCKWIPGSDAQKFDAAKRVVTDKLKDPTTPLFTDLRAAADGACGFVNSKNSFGAYSGKSKFVVDTDGRALIEGFESDNSGISAMNACELERVFSACQAGGSLLSASIESAKECDSVGKQAIENQFGLPSGSISRIGPSKAKH